MEAKRTPEHFETDDEVGIYRPTGQVSLGHAVQLITDAIVYAREQRIRKLLIVTSLLSGFESPDSTARFEFVQKWVHAAGGAMRIAIVARLEMIDPQKFGITVAANRGLIADVFATEAEAMVGLRGDE